MSVEGFPRPPDRFIVNTGEGQVIEEEKIRFFEAVLDFVGYDLSAKEAFAEILPMVLHRYDSRGQVRPTDDSISLLIMKGRLAASLVERRNDFNYVEVSFACYLTPELVSQLRESLGNK